jgi:hypothetical protein
MAWDVRGPVFGMAIRESWDRLLLNPLALSKRGSRCPTISKNLDASALIPNRGTGAGIRAPIYCTDSQGGAWRVHAHPSMRGFLGGCTDS